MSITYRALSLVSLLCVTSAIVPKGSPAQPAPANTSLSWTSTANTDPLTGQQTATFHLRGQFIDAPAHGSARAPEIIVSCDPKPFRRLTGRFISGFVDVGAVVDLTNGDASTVQFRLDDGKPQYLFGALNSTDYQGIGFDSTFLDNILWGHLLPHKPGTNGPVRKLIIAVQEHLDGRIVMQFDMPDPSIVSRVCGAEYKQIA